MEKEITLKEIIQIGEMLHNYEYFLQGVKDEI